MTQTRKARRDSHVACNALFIGWAIHSHCHAAMQAETLLVRLLEAFSIISKGWGRLCRGGAQQGVSHHLRTRTHFSCDGV
jgi:hypothetical protein